MTSPSLTVTLPWPDPVLNPNARAHWIVERFAKRDAKKTAWALVLQSMGRNWWAYRFTGTLDVSLIFHPPSSHRRDRDNCQASMKAALDGIAGALSVDDTTFRPVSDWGPNTKGGKVVVTITQRAPE